MISMLMHASIKLQLIVYEYIYYIQVLLISNLKSFLQKTLKTWTFFQIASINFRQSSFAANQTLWIMGSVSVSVAKV